MRRGMGGDGGGKQPHAERKPRKSPTKRFNNHPLGDGGGQLERREGEKKGWKPS